MKSPTKDPPPRPADEAELPARPPQPPAPDRPPFEWILWLLGALLLVVPALDLPDEGATVGLKAFMLEAVGIVLAVYIVSSGEWTWDRARAALLAPPNLAILTFLVWVGISAVRTDVPPLYKRMSHAEAMRYFGGALIYFSVVYGLSVRQHLRTVVSLLVAAGSVGAIVAAYTYVAGIPNVVGQTHIVQGAFPDMDILAGFLLLTLVPTLVAAVSEREIMRRITAQVAVVLITAIIIACGNRAIWFGLPISLAAAIGLFAYSRRGIGLPRFERHDLVIPGVVLVLIVGLSVWLMRTQQNSQRLKALPNFTKDEVFHWRLGMMNKGLRIMRDHPLLGSGIGTFRIEQALYYHPDAVSRSQREILKQPHDKDNCQSSYLQVGAELGVPGLILYVNIFLTFLVTGIGALRKMRAGYRQAILIGCLAAIIGGLVMVTMNEAWEYAEVSLFVWLLLGVGMAISGVGERGRVHG